MPNKRRSCFQRGNALMEYALPAGIFILGVGIFATSMNLNGLLAQFYALVNGDSASAISGGRYTAQALGTAASGTQGNGAASFNFSGNKGGSGGFGPGIEIAGGSGGNGFSGGFTSSGSSSADSTGGQGQDEVLAALKGAKSPMDVYNAIKDAPFPQEFKGLVQAMAQQQLTMSASSKSKASANTVFIGPQTSNSVENKQKTSDNSDNTLADALVNLSGTQIAMLMYSANPASARDIAQYGGDAVVALAKAYSDSSLNAAMGALLTKDPNALSKYAETFTQLGIKTADIVNGKYSPEMAQVSILMALNVLDDPAKSKAILDALKQNPPPSLATLQAMASGITDPAQLAEIANLSDGTCAAAAICIEERDKLLKEAKQQLQNAQSAINAENQSAADTAMCSL